MTGKGARDEPMLPQGWTRATLGETCQIVLGQSPPSSTYNTERVGLPFYQGKAEFGNLYPVPTRWCSEPIKIAKAGDVLFSVRAPVGPTNLCRERSCIGRGLAAVRPRAGMPSRYFFYFLRSVEQGWIRKATGTTFAAVNGKVLRAQKVPLAPLAEQFRIVAEIEKLLTQLEAGVAALERVRAKLKRYKTAVLELACGGQLVPTEATLARKESRDYEPADQLLARVLIERRARWEATYLEKRRAKSQEPESDRWKQKYRPPVPPGVQRLPPLPEGWCWAALGQLLESIKAGRSPQARARPARPGEVGVLKVSAISWEEFLPEENKALWSGDDSQGIPVVRAGDLLISRANTVDLVGAVVVVERDYPQLVLSDKTLRLVLAAEDISRKYLLYALRAPGARGFLANQATGTSDSMRNISQAKLRATPIPLPPVAEQRRIVEQVERRFSAIAALEAAVADNLARAGQLRQVILKAAFAGRLIPQDPADESASALLGRMRAHHA